MRIFMMSVAIITVVPWQVMAQEALPTMAMPDEVTPAPMAVPEAAVPAQTTPSAESDDELDLCPEPREALSKAPGQLDALQEDIDRYTLCLARAELLVKLEELKNKNKEAGMMDAMALPMGAPTAPQPLSDQEVGLLLGAPPADGTAAPVAPPMPETYMVKDIRGVNGALTARLMSPSGGMEQVQEGDVLDDGSTVTSVSAVQVMIRTKDGKTERLSWGG